MTNRDAYREHAPRMRTSLDGVLGMAATSEGELRTMARQAWQRRGVVVFIAGRPGEDAGFRAAHGRGGSGTGLWGREKVTR